MDRLCDDILQLVFDRLDYPGGLALVNKQFYAFSQDPYVRSHYFMYRYGPTQALYYALGRGKVLNERVLDILMSSGAHFSRYLVQIALHHYFHTRSHFIKTNWVRSVPLNVFTYLLKLAGDAYGDIPRGKTEDDGTIFNSFLQESRFVESSKRVNWETVREILEKYKFIPFCDRDPLMTQFPLALALEPRLLPYAVTNGFTMDCKYRNFIFRRMFERSSERTAESIANNARELCRLDSTMFVSCTVAAEVCMEAKFNAHGYAALKALSLSNDLVFDLRTLVEDLLKLFYKTRSITNKSTQEVLRYLWKDFPSPDPTVRLVMLLTVFLSGDVLTSVATLRNQVSDLRLGPITENDVRNLMISPWMEKFEGLLQYMRKEVISDATGKQGLASGEIMNLIEEVAVRCLEIGCKGRMLKKLSDAFTNVRVALCNAMEQHRVDFGSETMNKDECARYRLGRSWYQEGDDRDYFWDHPPLAKEGRSKNSSRQHYGPIGQESLTTMIRQEENVSSRSRRRYHSDFSSSGLLNTPFDPSPLHVGKWIKQEFGPRNRITATFLTHAIINENVSILDDYLRAERPADLVPITMQHFKLLARLHRAPSYILYRYIEKGGEFFTCEEDYLCRIGQRTEIKRESLTPPKITKPPTTTARTSPSTRKRPRRSAADTIQSYADAEESADEMMVDDTDWKARKVAEAAGGKSKTAAKAVAPSPPLEEHLRLWIKHLRDLLRVEQAQHVETKRQLVLEAAPGAKVRVLKNEFFKSLEVNLRALRKLDSERRQESQVPTDNSCSDFEDDEEYSGPRKGKRRRTTTITT